MSVYQLQKSIEDLKRFLEPTGSTHWIGKLDEIASELSNEDSRSRAVKELESLFGGMGSLNDLYFCDTNGNLPEHENVEKFNAKFSKLLDRVFKELQLLNSGILARIQWAWFAFKYRKDLAPRIKKSFR